MPSHPSADDMRAYITINAAAAAASSPEDPRYEVYHECINEALDQMDREGGPSYGQHG